MSEVVACRHGQRMPEPTIVLAKHSTMRTSKPSEVAKAMEETIDGDDKVAKAKVFRKVRHRLVANRMEVRSNRRRLLSLPLQTPNPTDHSNAASSAAFFTTTHKLPPAGHVI